MAMQDDSGSLRLRVLSPTEVLVDEAVAKVIADAADGCFCLLPRHVDFVAALTPGILSFFTHDGAEHFVALDEGTLVKCAREVLVSTFDGVRGDDLERLQATLRERLLDLDEHERTARTALARLEAGTIRRFMALQERLRA